jgi:trehalose synthase
VGRDETNQLTDAAWQFLRPFLAAVRLSVFSRHGYAPPWVPPEKLAVIPPSIDPFSAKNLHLTRDQVMDVLATVGLVAGGEPVGTVSFVRRDGGRGTVRDHAAAGGLVLDGSPPPPDAPLVVQVSRWDRLKDMAGVMSGFALLDDASTSNAHLVLAGPAVAGVSDDPEGAEVLEACRAQWHDLAPGVRDRVHLVTVPMDDVDENATVVNALQRHARIVVQKSLVEGFGLTVTEAMWKAKPVLASGVGGIRDQIRTGLDGLLLDDPSDLEAFAAQLRAVLADAPWAARLGAAAEARVRDEYLPDRHLEQYAQLFGRLASVKQGS